MKHFTTKSNWKKALEHIRNRKTFAADCIKKKGNSFSITLIRKLFWKTIKPFFSNKGNYGSQIKLVEKDEVLQDDDLIAKKLNKCFKNVVSTLNIKENRFITNRSSDSITEPLDKAINKHQFPQVFF